MSTTAITETKGYWKQRRKLERLIFKLSDVIERQLRAGQLTFDRVDHIEDLIDELNLMLFEHIELKKIEVESDELLERVPERRHTFERILEDYEILLMELEQIRELTCRNRGEKAARLFHGWVARLGELGHREVTLLQECWNVDAGTMD